MIIVDCEYRGKLINKSGFRDLLQLLTTDVQSTTPLRVHNTEYNNKRGNSFDEMNKSGNLYRIKWR